MHAPSSRKRYLSVWLRRLTTDRLLRAGSPAPADAHAGGSGFAPSDTPLVVVAPVKGALRLAAVNDAADGLGLKPGMALADARAMYPRIAVADADPEADRRLLLAIADGCDRYTPLVGLDPPDGLILDIAGCAHLFGGEESLRRDLVARLVRQGFQARAAVADTVGCAWAVARYGDDNVVRGRATRSPPPPELGFTRVRHIEWSKSETSDFDRGKDRVGGGGKFGIHDYPPPHPSPARGEGADRVRGLFCVPSDQTVDALLPLPLAALRIAPETVTELAQVGLKRIADAIDRPRAPLAARFGEAFVRRLDQALGLEDEPITPRLPVPAYVTERRFAEPIAREADVLGTIEHLARALVKLMERRGEGARLIETALFRTDGKVHRIAAGTGAPLRDAARIRALFVERLAAVGDECDPGFGYDVIRLGALATQRCDPAQTGLAGGDHAEELAHLIDRLGARFGLRRVTRLVPQDTHIPEYAVAEVAAATCRNITTNTSLALRRLAPHGPLPLQGGGTGWGSPRQPPTVTPSPLTVTPSPTLPLSGGGGRPPVLRERDSFIEQDSLSPTRPIRLFDRPEPVEATAAVPDGPPVQFTWRRVRYVVAHAEGPERIAMEWWRDDQGNALTRDYFRVESREGVRVWLFRQGLFTDGAPTSWFLHGVFA
ncbi:MAG: DNA polymerase Y family protein [Xanthobacteraceae bacterium]|nr:DNA polymerase Y family protein [Xanthobacteraceae bacterium]